MSKLRRIRLDVYGAFTADVIREKGTWVAYRRGADGKRSLLCDLVLSPDASVEDVLLAFDAAYHELAGTAPPDADLEVIDLLMA